MVITLYPFPGRDGIKSVGILLLAKKCTVGRKLSPLMKSYIDNMTICRRKVLLRAFKGNHKKQETCCDICNRSDTTTEILTAPPSPAAAKMSPEDIVELTKRLTGYYNVYHVEVPEIIPTFPHRVIHEIVKNECAIVSVESLLMLTSLIDPTHASPLFSILANVRGNISETEAMYACTQDDETEKSVESSDESDSDSETESYIESEKFMNMSFS